jgi:ferrous iron transport protein A
MGNSVAAHTAVPGVTSHDARPGKEYLTGRPANVRAIMRTQPQGAHDQTDPVIVLAQLTPGTRATVVGTVADANPVIANRLGQLGFRSKARVDVVRRAPLGDPTIYRVHDTELCLRRREAQLIEVVPEADR